MVEKAKKAININYMIKGILISLLFTFISLLILSAILTYSSLSEKIMSSGIIVINSISILVGTTIAINGQKSNGIIKGGLCGLIFIAIIYLISSLASLTFSLDFTSIIMVISSIIAGMIGGIIGVNINK